MRLNLTPWLDRYSWLKRAHDVAIFAQRRARDVKMAQVAGSLTFTTTLTIVPLFAVALALFTAFPLFVEFRGAVENAVLKALARSNLGHGAGLHQRVRAKGDAADGSRTDIPCGDRDCDDGHI